MATAQPAVVTRRRLPRRALLPGTLLVLACALLSGMAIPGAPRPMTLLHLLTGLGGCLPLLFFLQRHWWRRRRRVGDHPNARFGYAALVALLLLLLSGLLLLVWTSWPWLQHTHSAAAWSLTLILTIHGTWRLRRRTHAAPAGGLLLLGGVAVTGGAALLVGPAADASRPVTAAVPVAHASLHPASLPTAAACAACHGDVSAAWEESAHAAAAGDPYYLALATLFVQEQGVDAARYCAACHSPVGLMGGEIAASAGQRPGGSGANAYEARSLGVELTLSPAAAEGVTCVICHRAAGPDAVLPGPSLPADPLSALALRAAPAQHRADLSPAVLNEAALCADCHNLTTPDGFLLEPTYDEWLASPYAAEGVTCQACHMPNAPGAAVDSTVGGTAAVHGGLPGAPSSLDGVSSATDLLGTAATVTLTWQKAATAPERLAVQVTNSGTGHYLPTGADDLRQVWLEVTVRDAAGNLLWQQGTLDGNDRLPADAIQFRKVLGDAANRPVTLHRFWVATQVLEDTRLAPRETRTFNFAIPPADGAMTATARLLYRDVDPGFAEFALGTPVTRWPPLEMAAATISVP